VHEEEEEEEEAKVLAETSVMRMTMTVVLGKRK